MPFIIPRLRPWTTEEDGELDQMALLLRQVRIASLEAEEQRLIEEKREGADEPK